MKPWWQSKTILINVIGATVLYFLGLEEVQANADIVAIVAAGINIILRFVSSDTVTVK